MEEDLDIVVKSSGGNIFKLKIAPTVTVKELKEKVAAASGIPVEQQRLIYSGRILKDPEEVSTYKIKSGNTVHLVKCAKRSDQAGAGTALPRSAATTAAGTSGSNDSGAGGIPMATGQVTGNPLSDLTGARYSGLANLPSASMFGPDGGVGPMPSPEEVSNMLSRNPEMLQGVMNMMLEADDSDPIFQSVPPEQRQQMRMIVQNPEFRDLMADPQRMRQALEAGSRLNQMMSAYGGSAGSGMPAPGQPSGDSTAAPRNPLMDPEFMAQFSTLRELGLPGTSDPFASVGSFGGGAAPVQADMRPPEERYEVQLRQLNELGFFDFDRNVRALRRSGGNVEGAVEALLEGHV